MKCTDHGVLFVLDNSPISDYNFWYEIGLRRWKDAVTSGNRNSEI